MSGDTECSRASAGRLNRSRQRGPWIRCNRGRTRSGLLGGDAEVEELERADEEELDIVR